LEELLLIPDVPRDLLLGRDLNYNYRLSAHETGDRSERVGDQLGGGSLPWTSLLTLYSAERNVNPRGQARIALNAADLQALFSHLGQVVDPSWAKFIVLYRQYGPAQASAPGVPVGALPGGAPPAASGQRPDEVAATLDFSRPGVFSIASVLDLIGAQIVLMNPLTKQSQIVTSPFSTDREAMRKYLPVLLDETTLIAGNVIRGRVNLNTATRAVLRGVPGIDDHLVESIVSNRHAASDDLDRRCPTWLLTEGLVDIPQMKALLPYVTCGGQVYRAQVIAYFEEGGPVARAEIVLDATLTPPAPVSWTDLRVRGRGFSANEL
jgi:DNA uptake protein ComE-like DNA-binding protein